MTNVVVPFGDNQADTATLLLAAAEELGLEPHVVSVAHYDGGFEVPEEVAQKAKADTVDPNAKLQAEVDAVKAGSELPSQAVTDEEAEAKAQANLVQTGDESERLFKPRQEPAKKVVPPNRKPRATKKTTAKKATAKKSTAKKGN